MKARLLFAAALAGSSLYAQIGVFAVDSAGEHPVAEQFSLGSVAVGDTREVHFRLKNAASSAATLTLFSVSGTGFSVAGPPPLPLELPAAAAVDFTVRFQPAAPGAYSASLRADGISAILFASAIPSTAVELPKPEIVIDLAEPASARQGKLSVRFSEPARAAGSGKVLIGFRPAAGGAGDPAILFPLTASRSAPFTVVSGETEARFGSESTLEFQTGTTAGLILFTVQLGKYTEQGSVTVAPAPPGIGSIRVARTASGLELRISGFDNSRSTSQAGFTFFDASGTPVAPGSMQVDVARAFRSYFESTDAGGLFELRAAFPVSGTAGAIGSVEIEISNALGSSRSPRVRF